MAEGEPANAETQSACITGTAPAFPVVVVGVKPAKQILTGTVTARQRARYVATRVRNRTSAGDAYVPLLLLLPLVHVEQLYPYRWRPLPGIPEFSAPDDVLVLGSIHAPEAGMLVQNRTGCILP